MGRPSAASPDFCVRRMCGDDSLSHMYHILDDRKLLSTSILLPLVAWVTTSIRPEFGLPTGESLKSDSTIWG